MNNLIEIPNCFAVFNEKGELQFYFRDPQHLENAKTIIKPGYTVEKVYRKIQ